MIHDALLPAVHEQALVVETLTVRVPARSSTFWSSGEIEYLQAGAGAGGGGTGAGGGGAGAGAGTGVGEGAGAGAGGGVCAAAWVTTDV